MFKIYMGVPEMKDFWESLKKRVKAQEAGKSEVRLYKKLGKALRFLSENPHHPGLQSHEITSLSRRYGRKVWQSYLENHTPAAGRIFWVYGPEEQMITVIGLEPHPEDKDGAYERITLSGMRSDKQEHTT